MVEDNQGDVLLTEEALLDGNINFTMDSVNHGEAAIEYFENVKKGNKSLPDLVLMDINLPRINGHEVIAFLRNDSAFKNVPIFIISSSSAPADMEKSKPFIQHYLTKPLDLEEFFKGLDKI